MKRSDRAGRLVWLASPTILSVDLETLPAGTKPRPYRTNDRLEDRGGKRESARRSFLQGRERDFVSQTNIGTVSKTTLGKPQRNGDGWST